MKKLVSVFLLVCMLVSVLPAMALADKWTTLRVEMYDRSIAGFNVEDCWQLHYIQENFGNPNKIKVEWVSVSRWAEGEILSRQLAGGTAPDLCMTYGTDLLQQYIDQGGIKPLDELIEKYGQDIPTFLGDEVMQYGQFDAGSGMEQYYLPARRIIVATRSMFIRQDWLDQLNMAIPTNVEELYAYLTAAKEQNLGGERTIPFSSDLYDPDPFNGWIYQLDSFVDYDQITAEDWVAYNKFHYLLPGAKEAILSTPWRASRRTSPISTKRADPWRILTGRSPLAAISKSKGGRTMKVSDGMTYAPRGKRQPVVKPGEFVFSAVRLDHGHIYGMCNGLTEAGATLKYVYDPDEKKVAAFLKAFPQAKAARSEEEALSDPETHLIAGAAITSERCTLGLRVLDAGKDYFTDKAPFTTMAQLQTARAKVAETGKKYMVYYSERLHDEGSVLAGSW